MVTIREIDLGTPLYEAVVELADTLGQRRYVVREYPTALRRIMIAALEGDECPVGLLFAIVQILGAEKERSPIVVDWQPLLECYVEALVV